MVRNTTRERRAKRFIISYSRYNPLYWLSLMIAYFSRLYPWIKCGHKDAVRQVRDVVTAIDNVITKIK